MWTVEQQGDLRILRRVARPPAVVLVPESPWTDLDREMGPTPTGRYVVDIADERYLTSEALSVLVGLVRRVQQAGGRMVFASSQPGVISVLDSTRLSRLVPVVPDVSAALVHLRT